MAGAGLPQPFSARDSAEISGANSPLALSLAYEYLGRSDMVGVEEKKLSGMSWSETLPLCHCS